MTTAANTPATETAPQFNPELWLSRATVAGLPVQADPAGLIVGFPDVAAHPGVHAYQTSSPR